MTQAASRALRRTTGKILLEPAPDCVHGSQNCVVGAQLKEQQQHQTSTVVSISVSVVLLSAEPSMSGIGGHGHYEDSITPNAECSLKRPASSRDTTVETGPAAKAQAVAAASDTPGSASAVVPSSPAKAAAAKSAALQAVAAAVAATGAPPSQQQYPAPSFTASD